MLDHEKIVKKIEKEINRAYNIKNVPIGSGNEYRVNKNYTMKKRFVQDIIDHLVDHISMFDSKYVDVFKNMNSKTKT